MRRLTLAALVGTLVLSACSDQRQSPTEPAVSFSKAKCAVVPFPHTTVVAQIKNVFPPGLRGREVSQSAAIKNDWDACRPGQAQQGVVNFINGMNLDFQAGRLVGTNAQRNQLITTLLTAVGLASPPSFGLGPDFGVGLYDPNKTTPQIFQTAGGTALTELLHGAFSEFTVIVISRRPDGSDPLDFDGNQFPPFFDYNALNASGNHFFENAQTATIAFCQLPQTEGFQYPPFEDIKIGHNKPTVPVEFEALDPVVREDLFGLLNCGNLDENIALGHFSGLQSLARASGRYLAPIARALFMPTPLQAATTAVGYGGPIATKPGSFSPFGIVESTTQNQVVLYSDDPAEEGHEPYYVNQTIDTCDDGCTPTFYITGPGESGPITTPTDITVTLVPEGESSGTLNGDTTKPTSGEAPYTADFNDLSITQPGDYHLVVSAPGASSYITGSFHVSSSY